jgi:hypothetical protein
MGAGEPVTPTPPTWDDLTAEERTAWNSARLLDAVGREAAAGIVYRACGLPRDVYSTGDNFRDAFARALREWQAGETSGD